MRRPTCFLVLALTLGPPVLAAAQDAAPKAGAKPRPSIYDPKADAREQVRAAGAEARRDNQRILVMFGGDWCGWCHKLHALFGSDPAIRKALSEDYRLVMVDTEAPNAAGLLEECKGDLQGVGFPFLAVLDADGKVLTRQKTDPLEEGDHHDPAKVLAFLGEWAPAKQSAAAVLDGAMAKASADGKLVFLHFGAPWCGWCHKLDDFLAREDIAPRIARDFVDVKIDVDRMEGGKEVEARFRKDTAGGIPWIAFLDPTGKAIADSDAPGGNIGYPAAPAEIAHFVAMLKKAARRLDADDIAAIERVLKDEGQAIERARPAAIARPAND